MKNTKFIAIDCNGQPLQFTGAGKSVQCKQEEADQFNTRHDANMALKRAEEVGGYAEEIEVEN